MFIPIITVFSDVVRLLTFQPPRVEGSTPFVYPCPEVEHDLPPVERCAPAAARLPDFRDETAARSPLLPQAERC
jgi:hypothetical protein